METRESGTFLHQESNMFDMQKVGERIAALRRRENMTQAELAEKLGISYQAVSSWERGATMPDISKLLELSRALGTSVDALLGGEMTEDTARVAAEEPIEKVEAQASEMQEGAEAERAEASSFGDGMQDMMARLREQLREQMENVRENLLQIKQQFAESKAEGQATVTIQQTGKNQYVIHIPDEEDDECIESHGRMTVDAVSALASHMDQDMLEDVLVDAINDGDEDMAGEIASYLEPETIARAMERATEPLTAEIMGELADYMGSGALGKCAMQALNDEDDEMMEEIAEHLDDDVLEWVLENFKGELTLDMVETLSCHASEKALDLIIQKCDLEDSDVIEELSPYLNQRQMRELIKRLRNS